MKHALVLEDNYLIAMMIEDDLIEHGYGSVEIATTQEQAIEMARIRCPDLIIVDDLVDSGTGVETIRMICRNRTIPVVFITDIPDAVEGAPSDAFMVPKPFWKPRLAAAWKADRNARAQDLASC